MNRELDVSTHTRLDSEFVSVSWRTRLGSELLKTSRTCLRLGRQAVRVGWKPIPRILLHQRPHLNALRTRVVQTSLNASIPRSASTASWSVVFQQFLIPFPQQPPCSHVENFLRTKNRWQNIVLRTDLPALIFEPPFFASSREELDWKSVPFEWFAMLWHGDRAVVESGHDRLQMFLFALLCHQELCT